MPSPSATAARCASRAWSGRFPTGSMTASGAGRPSVSAGGSSVSVAGRPESGAHVTTGAFEALGSWPGVLGRLAGGGDLDAEESAAALGDVLAGNATPAQVAAFVFGLRCKGETVAEMTGLVRAMVAASERVVVDPALAPRLVDTCGTGGDRSGTINVSTIAALVLAGAGVPVCKHGGRAASSRAGSADVLEALGVVIDLGPAGVRCCIEEVGIGFCFAPRYHPAMRYAIPIRRELGVATAFNFLGPLANPARLGRQVVGVGDPGMATKVCGVLAANGSTHVLVVYGADGLDELTTTAPSTVVEWIAPPAAREASVREAAGDAPGTSRPSAPAQAELITSTVIDAADLGLRRARPEELLGGDVETNARLTRAVLDGELGARRDIVVLNAAAGLVAAGSAAHLAEGVTLAGAAIDDGRAAGVLDRLIEVSSAWS